jgi:aminoglycoside/choline kinase family phosphotransferase
MSRCATAKAQKAGPLVDTDGELHRGVEWMSLQRHPKVAGIFARLTLRDGNQRPPTRRASLPTSALPPAATAS